MDALLLEVKHVPSPQTRASDPVDPWIETARRELKQFGCAVVSWLIPPEVRRAIGAEAVRLADRAGVRRDLVLSETDFTPRRMVNVARAQIVEHSSLIPWLYESEVLIETLALVVGHTVHRCPYEPEQFVITRLERSGDTHGWHWDDYSFALVWVAECPPATDGGFVEYVPNTLWDKHYPAIDQLLRERDVHRLEVGGGEVYLMLSKTTLHRVHPLRQGRRTIVNMAYAAADELCEQISHETMDTLWSSESNSIERG